MMKVWIDFDNAPHVHFFAPIIRRLREEGLDPILTVRSFGQTEELARQYGFEFHVVGNHLTPVSTLGRVGATLKRSAQLLQFIRGRKISAAISHGSRAQAVAAWTAGIPGMSLYDYEFVSSRIYHLLSRKVLVPSVIPLDRVGASGELDGKLVRYPGFKEEVYVYDFQPDPSVLSELGLDSKRMIIVVRPPASWAHYHCEQSEILFRKLMERVSRENDGQVVLLPRTHEQSAALQREFPIHAAPFICPSTAVDALSLMNYADAVVSGGGTMGREAALLGVDAYSTFAGKLGAADSRLAELGRLRLLRDPKQVASLVFEKRMHLPQSAHRSCATREFIVGEIVRFMGVEPCGQLESSYSSAPN